MLDWLGRVKRAVLTGSAFLVGSCGGERTTAPRRVLGLEPLEPRLPMSAAGLVPVGMQPEGSLTGKIVYTSAGHGWNYVNGAWRTDRGDNNEIVEDFGNQEQMTYYVEYLLRAGATVVPMRPVGRQLNEVVLDNDSAGVTFTGSWSTNTAGPRWYDENYGAGGADGSKYRFHSISATETATATYTPNIPQSGFYPVYTWVAHGGNRASQLYKINHTGGQTQIRIDHRLVGNGWVYLGTYHFDAGTSTAEGSVVISNQSTAGAVVIADAIRFGNGMGDVPNGPSGIGTGSPSPYPREDENSLHWLWRGIGEGIDREAFFDTNNPNNPNPNVSAPSDTAEHMNLAPFGTSVYIGIHSNATPSHTGRGAIGLIDTDVSERTPNQASLATFVGRQINQDMQALNGVFEVNWSDRTTHTFTSQYGEINLGTNAEMDATIVEVGFHDNAEDSLLLRDPKARDQMARSTYEATLEYFNNFGRVANTLTLPSAPINVRAVSNASGHVTISWSPGPTGVRGGAASGFRIYASADGYGFDGGTPVAGGGTTTFTLSGHGAGYDPDMPYYFKVAAVNAAGESHASEVLTVLPSGGAKQVLIVNGFDRLDRHQNFRLPYAYDGAGNLVDRVWPRYNNSFDYVVQVHSAIHAAAPGVHVNSTSNEAVISGAVNLTDYDTVIWILGEESEANDTFNATEQTKVEQFIAGGGNLFVTGSEIAWDLDQQNNGRVFYENTLKGNYLADSANTYNVTAAASGIFAGIPNFSFSNGAQFSSLTSQMYNVNSADVISPQPGAQAALNYASGAGNAGIQVAGTGGRGSVVMFGFPFETITTAANRAAVIDRVFDFFGLAAIVPDNADSNRDGIVNAADYVVWRKNYSTSVPPGTRGDANHDGVVNDGDYEIWRAQFGTSPAAASATTASTTAAAAVSPRVTAATSSQDQASAIEETNGFGIRDTLPRTFATNVSNIGLMRRPSAKLHRAVMAQANPSGLQSLLRALDELTSRDEKTEQIDTSREKTHGTATQSSPNHGQPDAEILGPTSRAPAGKLSLVEGRGPKPRAERIILSAVRILERN